MCERYRLTRRSMMEIEHYYGVDDVNDLELWERSSIYRRAKWRPSFLESRGIVA